MINIQNLNSAQKNIILISLGIVFITIFLILYFFFKSNNTSLKYNITGKLTQKELSETILLLEQEYIPYSIVGYDNNFIIKTNKENINKSKSKFLESLNNNNKNINWNIFNYLNKKKHNKKVLTNLEEIINNLNAIKKSTISFSLSKKNEYLITISLIINNNMNLSLEQINGIKKFVSLNIKNIKINNIKLIDKNGNILDKNIINTSDKFLQQNIYQKKIEENLNNKVLDILKPIFGKENLRSSVNITLYFKKTKINQEVFAPEGIIRSKSTQESTNNKFVEDNNINDIKNNKTYENITTNYEISKKIILEEDHSYSQIKNIYIAVTINRYILKKLNINVNDLNNQINSLISNSTGLDKKRGDRISIGFFPFIKKTKQNKIKDNNLKIDNSFIKELILTILKSFILFLILLIIFKTINNSSLLKNNNYN